MLKYETQLFKNGYKQVAGLDEAGRGCWAGPLVVAICILEPNYVNNEINDSKKISRSKRFLLFEQIKNNALYWDYIVLSAQDVDKLNPKKASIIAMEELINKANKANKIDFALIDAEEINSSIPTLSIIKGDQLSQSIAAASIIAKTIRDLEIKKIDEKYPNFGFINHQGYGTKEHLEKLKIFGPIFGVHRFSYKPIKTLKNKAK